MADSSDPRRRELAAVFGHDGVSAAHRHRPPYPPDVFDVLDQLIADEPRAVLDIGAGDGAIARPLAPRVDRVDAVDMSAAMLDAGRRRPGGQRLNLRWIHGAVETTELTGPYGLVTAGACLHWMRWQETFDRLARVMTSQARLAIIDHGPRDIPWQEELVAVIKRHSRNPEFDPRFSIVDALSERDLFQVTGAADSSPMRFRQSIADYVEQFHSTATLAREHMSEPEARDFDLAVERLVRPWARDGVVELTVVATVTWGGVRGF